MVIRKIIDKVPIKSSFAELILGAVLVGLLVSLGTVGVLRLFGMPVKPPIPSVFAGVAAAIYAAGTRKKEKRGC